MFVLFEVNNQNINSTPCPYFEQIAEDKSLEKKMKAIRKYFNDCNINFEMKFGNNLLMMTDKTIVEGNEFMEINKLMIS